MGNKLFVRQMKRTVACVAAAATVFSMNPAGLPYAGGQAGAFVVDAATESTAVEISTYEQFAAFAKAVNAGTAESYASVKLTADITIPSGTTWTPIGSAANPYTGVFDGDGHTVSGLTASITAAEYNAENDSVPFGLFGQTQGATIKNLKMSNVEISGSAGSGSGILCGRSIATTISGCTIDNSCTFNGNTAMVGGLGCMLIESTVSDCVVAVQLQLENQAPPAGGYVYVLSNSQIINSIFKGTIKGTGAISLTGGFVGVNSGLIANCIYSGTMTAAGYNMCSAFAGEASNSGTIVNCFANGKFSLKDGSTGTTTGIFRGNGNGNKVANCIANAAMEPMNLIGAADNVTDCVFMESSEIAAGNASYKLNGYAASLTDAEKKEYHTSEWKSFVETDNGSLTFSSETKVTRKVTFYDTDNNVISGGSNFMEEGAKLVYPEAADPSYIAWVDSKGRIYDKNSVVGSEDLELYPLTEGYVDSLLNIKQVSITLDSDISLVYLVDPAVLERYQNATIVYRDASGTVQGASGLSKELTKTVNGKTYLYGEFTGIAAKEMTKDITATLEGTSDGGMTNCYSKAYTTSVADYAKRLIAMDGTSKVLKKLLVDLVNYGASAQTYFGYNTSDLANTDFDDYQTYASAKHSLTGFTNSGSSVTNSGNVKISGRTLVLENRVGIAVIIDTSEYEGNIADITINVNGTGVSDVIAGQDLKPYGTNKYYGVTYEILPTKMDETYTFTVQVNGEASARMTYGISAYAYNMRNNSNTKLVALLQDIMEYGNSALSYWLAN